MYMNLGRSFDSLFVLFFGSPSTYLFRSAVLRHNLSTFATQHMVGMMARMLRAQLSYGQNFDSGVTSTSNIVCF